MGVEQYGLGFRVTLGIFYEVEARGVGTKGNACGAQEGAGAARCGGKAVLGGLIAVELHAGARDGGAGSHHVGGAFIDEQQHRGHEGRQAPRQFCSALHRHGARTGGVEHKTHRIGTRSHGGVHVLFAGESADLDSSALHGG